MALKINGGTRLLISFDTENKMKIKIDLWTKVPTSEGGRSSMQFSHMEVACDFSKELKEQIKDKYTRLHASGQGDEYSPKIEIREGYLMTSKFTNKEGKEINYLKVYIRDFIYLDGTVPSIMKSLDTTKYDDEKKEGAKNE